MDIQWKMKTFRAQLRSVEKKKLSGIEEKLHKKRKNNNLKKGN